MDSRCSDTKTKKIDKDFKTSPESETEKAKKKDFIQDEPGEDELFQHLELREDDRHNFASNEDVQEPAHKINNRKIQFDLLGSRTYTSPDSLESSSGGSSPYKEEWMKTIRGYNAQQITSQSKSKSNTLTINKENSEKFSMLRNIVESIEDPEKRKMLLNFLDQSTIKTEYVTVKESSSSGEEQKAFRKFSKLNHKRRKQSPVSVRQISKRHRKHNNKDSYCRDRERFSDGYGRANTIAAQGQNIQNFAIKWKHGSDEFDSKNGDKWFTEESKEVPLEAILNKLNHYDHPIRMEDRRQSGYSASRDDQTNVGENDTDGDHIKEDVEGIYDLELGMKSKDKDIILLPEDLLKHNTKNTVKMVKEKVINRWSRIVKTLIITFLIFILIGVTTRGIFLEIKNRSYTSEIHDLNKEINELFKINTEWKEKYDQWAWNIGHVGIDNSALDNSNQNNGTPINYNSKRP